MKGDFSRQIFKKEKHYSQVLLQQGRVLLDADWNEQQAIQAHRQVEENVDLVGHSGVPKQNPGFQVTTQANNLLVSKGHLYVDGYLCENDAPLQFKPKQDVKNNNLVNNAVYLVFLEAWQRHVITLQDDGIREKALGGPDTTTRLQTFWQLGLLRLANPNHADPCAITPEWTALLKKKRIQPGASGQMAARTDPDMTGKACLLPPASGYQRLENQLYRVEVHKGGARSEATFKWSRENGSIVTAIGVEGAGDTLGGSEITVESTGKDVNLGFANGQWVELIDDSRERQDGRGFLRQIKTVDPASRKVVFETNLDALATQEHPLMRRWEQTGSAAGVEGVAMTATTDPQGWHDLEDGLQVRFSDQGEYKSGDYWLIPARTAFGQQPGTIEWSVDQAGEAVLQLPHGVQHHLAMLALVRRVQPGFALLADCRKPFPALTEITASDVSFDGAACALPEAKTVQQALDVLCQRRGGGCLISVAPNENLAAALSRIVDGQDADICLQVGEYHLPQAVLLEKKGHLHFSGAGLGTRLIAAKSEAVLSFIGCKSVSISELYAESGVVGGGKSGHPALNGTLSFIDCPQVSVESVNLKCAAGTRRAAACITVRNTALTDPLDPGPETVRIRGCNLQVGHQQNGILLVNVGRSQVEDNVVRVVPDPLRRQQLLDDKSYRNALRAYLLSDLQLTEPAAAAPSRTNVKLEFAGIAYHFRTDTLLARKAGDEWKRLLVTFPPKDPSNPIEVRNHLVKLSDDLVRGVVDLGGLPFDRMREFLKDLEAQEVAVLSQGIVVAGQRAGEVRLLNNTVSGARQGIHVAVSHRESAAGKPDKAGVVLVSNNRVEIILANAARRERHGILIGNCDSLVLENNFVEVQRFRRSAALPAVGIQVFGMVGPRLILRQNHLEDADFQEAPAGGIPVKIGIRFTPLNPAEFKRPQWIIADNIAPKSNQVVMFVDEDGNRLNSSLVRGLETNFA
jgi:hypothetical protein